jgi:tetratricopeptide (TPR) repeat protein
VVERMRGASSGHTTTAQVEDTPFAPSYPPPPVGQLIGRAHVLETLLAGWEPNHHAQGPRLMLVSGDAERADQALGESARIAGQVGDMQALRYAARVLAERDIVAGAPERARLALEPLLDRPGLRELDVAYILPTLAWAYLAHGDVAAARRHVGQALSRASAQGNRLVWHDALRIHGLTLAREGAWDDAAAALNEGLRMASAMPYPFAEARFWQAIASVERRQGERAQAQAALRRAADILRRLGARDE